MKKKNIKKIVSLITNEIRNEISNNYPVKSSEEEYRSEYDPEVSEKFRKLVLNIIQYKENIIINIIDNRFSVSTNDVNVIKNSYIPKSKNYNEDDYLEIMVDEKGFYINLGYRKRSRYADDKMFKDLSPAIRERLKEINFENFDDIWNDVMKKSGVIRDNNLDELGI
jgi:hypothetical protein